MRKALLVFVMFMFLVFALLAGPVLAQAQFFPGHLSGHYGRGRGYWGRGYYREHWGHHGHHDGWVGFGLGIITGALIDNAVSRRSYRPPPPPSYPYDYDGYRGNGRDSNFWFGQSQSGCQAGGQFTLKNESGEFVRVFRGDQPFAVLRPRQSVCGDPAEYEAEVIVAVRDGYVATTGVVRSKPEGRRGGVWVWR